MMSVLVCTVYGWHFRRCSHKMESEPPLAELELIIRVPWACAQCTYHHTDDEATFLACAVGLS
jgi:hypothetical protein